MSLHSLSLCSNVYSPCVTGSTWGQPRFSPWLIPPHTVKAASLHSCNGNVLLPKNSHYYLFQSEVPLRFIKVGKILVRPNFHGPKPWALTSGVHCTLSRISSSLELSNVRVVWRPYHMLKWAAYWCCNALQTLERTESIHGSGMGFLTLGYGRMEIMTDCARSQRIK